MANEHLAAGTRRCINIAGVDYHFRYCPPGRFLMGSPETQPIRFGDEVQHEVEIAEGFWLGEVTVNQALWKAVMGTNPSCFKGDDLPVEMVSWYDCMEFCTKAKQYLAPGQSLRLPTEAEWEYACRAGTQTMFNFGDVISSDMANYNASISYRASVPGVNRGHTVPVYSFEPNLWGFYQMHGNVWEWCMDWYGDYPDPNKIEDLNKFILMRPEDLPFDMLEIVEEGADIDLEELREMLLLHR